MTPRQGLAFVKRHGVVLQAARGPAPNLAEAIAGGPIKGSWWSHAKGREIFRVSERLGESPDVLVCGLLGGKVTYVHKRLWPALVRLAPLIGKARLARAWSEHGSSGAHRSRRLPFPRWVPEQIARRAARLSLAEAERALSPWPTLAPARGKP